MNNEWKIATEHGQYYKNIWLTLQDGGSGSWLYCCGKGATFIFISITDMVDACGKDADVWFCADVAVVDLSDSEQAGKALDSCGYQADDILSNFTLQQAMLATVEAMHGYGAASPMWKGQSGAINKSKKDWRYNAPGDKSPAFCCLRSDARKAAEELFDDQFREFELDSKIVNAIGQTARQYSKGIESLWDRLREIKELGTLASPAQQLVLKMYGKAKQTLGAGPVPEDLQCG